MVKAWWLTIIQIWRKYGGVFLTLHYHMHFINKRNEEIQAKILEFSADGMQQPLHVLILGMWQFYCHSYFALISLCYMAIRLWTFSCMETMCVAELTWYTLKVYNWILMKHTWWNWHAVPGIAYWNMEHTAGTLRKMGIYFILRNNWQIDVPWNISKIFYRISFFSVQHMVSILNCMIFLWYIMQIVHIANWCTWLAHTLCKGLIWNYENSWAQPWLHLGSCKCFNEVENVSGNFSCDWYRILFWNFEICTISLFNFGWWYTLMKNKHQISLYLGLKKMANILADNIFKWIFLKKITRCLAVCAFHTFFTMFPSWYHHEIFRRDYQWQKWCLCKSSRSKVKGQGYRGQNPN